MVWYGISLRILARDLLSSLFTPLTHYMWCLSSHSTHNTRVNKGATTSPSRRIIAPAFRIHALPKPTLLCLFVTVKAQALISLIQPI